MDSKRYYLNFILLLVVLVPSMFFLTHNIFLNNNARNNYLLTKEVPGIVKGSAKMVDTQAYFTKYFLETCRLKLDMVCTNSSNLDIAVGYKSASEALVEANNPIKEITFWQGKDVFQKNSVDYSKCESMITNQNRIAKEWDLFAIGFNADEYIKADERIWYLKIKANDGPYGYLENITIMANGTTYLLPEFHPNIHYINEFKLSFNNLIFETLLYPFFDCSKEIILPIRGVNHELAIQDPKTEFEIKGYNINSYSTTTPPIGSNTMWTIVFGTSHYESSLFDDLLYPPMECRSFILGCAKSSAPNAFKVGIMDYGWRVAYCMDGSTDQTDIATCSLTDDGYLESMFDFVNGKLGMMGLLIVFIASHGNQVAGDHLTITGASYWFIIWVNVVKLGEYHSKVDAITSDGTHMLLWVSACHGAGLNSFSASYHNYCMESWSFQPVHEGTPSNGLSGTGKYNDFCWLYTDLGGGVISARSECAFFFLRAAAGPCEYSVTEIGPEAQTYYNDHFDSSMYIQSTWSGSYAFYIDWGY